ncbi:MAG: citrate synthase [Bryobacteraceae bacterium]|nr:citrate synthase [Bryobacteraceae bacterium]
MATVSGAGLEGIIAADSEICYIDGDAGVLAYFGYSIDTLAENASFEEVIFLLWNGRLPQAAELASLKELLVSHRELPDGVTAFLASVPQGKPMHVLRTAVSMLAISDAQAEDMSPEANHTKAAKLMAKTATIVTSFNRLRSGEAVVPGDPSLSFAANFLYTLTGKRPDAVMERAFDVALTLHADHELNASTFAARVTAATLSDIYSAATAGICALKGPLHGGANEDVIKFLLAAGSKEKALAIVAERLANKQKIAGFGHRVYKTIDPRAIHLARLSKEIGERTGHVDLYETSTAMAEFIKSSKNLNANVDFFSASTYYSLGIPVDLFTPIFAVSRMSGWTAHTLEQYRNNRLIRPRADYKGKPVGQPWVPMDQR